jgi:hypothetical protein
MTAAKPRENDCILKDADRNPWKNGSAAEITIRIDDPDNSGLSWHCLERSKEAESNADRRTPVENGPAVAIADYTNEPDNNSISWNHLEDNESIDEVNSSDDHDQETTPTSEGQNFDLAKYIVSSTRYRYSIQYIVSYNTIHYF